MLGTIISIMLYVVLLVVLLWLMVSLILLINQIKRVVVRVEDVLMKLPPLIERITEIANNFQAASLDFKNMVGNLKHIMKIAHPLLKIVSILKGVNTVISFFKKRNRSQGKS